MNILKSCVIVIRTSTYKKGIIKKKLADKLNTDSKKACEIAKESKLFNNPSSNVYSFIEELENAKKLE
ncbi:hypothetical protein MM239_10985 [Belliella sp. DSM 111904]|uniref:Uncharacterized protein n=1 Tax=Belliella filtrata TaxID=2923435 RepID=A0ABS9V150_9BACT|nr:hypothetical protein [Belliella filtrata]MCH7409920.1 hypothetical protein [Belliella filtrata]